MGWFGQRSATIIDAFTLRRVIALPIVIAVVTAVVHGSTALSEFFLHQQGQMILGLPSWAYGLLAGLFLVLYFLLEYATRLRLEIQPKLRVSFDPDRGCLVKSPVQHFGQVPGTYTNTPVTILQRTTTSIFARVRADALSKSKVRGCIAFITAIESRNQSDTEFKRHQIYDPIPLDTKESDVPPNVPWFWDFVTVSLEAGSAPQFPVPVKLTLYEALKEHGTHRLTIQVVGEGVASEQRVEIHWTGDPQKIAFRAI
jgi:hypothetical protein